MNDNSGNKTKQQVLDQSLPGALRAGAKPSKAAKNWAKRTNIDEIARYVVEGLNQGKPEVKDRHSDIRTGDR